MQIHFVARTDSGSRHQEDAHPAVMDTPTQWWWVS